MRNTLRGIGAQCNWPLKEAFRLSACTFCWGKRHRSKQKTPPAISKKVERIRSKSFATSRVDTRRSGWFKHLKSGAIKPESDERPISALPGRHGPFRGARMRNQIFHRSPSASGYGATPVGIGKAHHDLVREGAVGHGQRHGVEVIVRWRRALRRAGIGYHKAVAGLTTPAELKRLVERLVDTPESSDAALPSRQQYSAKA